MIAATYYDPVLDDQDILVDAWVESWNRAGWRTMLLGPDNAKDHPVYQAYQKVVKSYPTINDRRYENACWLRWLAYADLAERMDVPIVATDYDVINRSWQPTEFPGDRITALHQVPTSACAGTKSAFDAFIVATLERAELGIERKGGLMHLSDMTLAFHLPELWNWNLVCEEWWPEARAPLVHVSACAVARHATTKAAVVAALNSLAPATDRR